MKARIIRQPRMQMGSKSNSEGGGGNGGSTSGSTSNDVVSPISRYNHSRLRFPEPAANNLLLDEDDVLSYTKRLLVVHSSTPLLFSFSSSTPNTPRLIRSNINSKRRKEYLRSDDLRSNLYSKYQLDESKGMQGKGGRGGEESLKIKRGREEKTTWTYNKTQLDVLED